MGRPQESRIDADIAVFGAGPVGCVAALAMAREGADVVLVESNPKSVGHRLAGELLHPSGVRMLRRLGVDPQPVADGYPNGRGFVISPDDGGRAIELPYEAGQRGLTCDHATLVTFLRRAVARDPHILYLPGLRVLEVGDRRLVCRRRGEVLQIVAGRLIGATGRSTAIAGQVAGRRPRRLRSGMAGLLLEGASLPVEGFGHILLGGPGPLLLYRIGERRVRLCCDVPLESWRTRADRAALLWESYRRVLPPPLRDAFERALASGALLFAPHYCLPRVHYGRDEIALVGDATGYSHPLTATGITLGFGDVACLLETRDLAHYRRRRLDTTRVPEILATSLYEIFSGTDPFSAALRQAIFDRWRRDAEACRRAVRLLALEETRFGRFYRHYLWLVLAAGALSLRSARAPAGVLARLWTTWSALWPWLLAPAATAWSHRLVWRKE